MQRIMILLAFLGFISWGCSGGSGGDTNGNIDHDKRNSSDTTPDQFTFKDLISVNRNTLVSSNIITVSGIDAPTEISVVGGEFSINGGLYTAIASIVTNGQDISVRQSSSNNFSTSTDTTLTIGGVSDTFTVTTVAEDTIPDSFALNEQVGVGLSEIITSNEIHVSGINSEAAVHIIGGEYSIDGAPFTQSEGAVVNGQSIIVRLTASNSYATMVEATLTIGGVSDTFTVTTVAEDTIPDSFAFNEQVGVGLSEIITSNEIHVSGINSETEIHIVDGEYSIDGAPFTQSNGTVVNGQSIVVRLTASSSYATLVEATLTIGGVSASFSVTTMDEVVIPNVGPFSFDDQTGVCTNQLVTSNSITITDALAPVAISITGGEYSIDQGPFTSNEGIVENGQDIVVRQLSSGELSVTTNSTLSIGNRSDTFSVTTFSSPDSNAPQATILFPPATSITTAETITVRGTASDSCDVTTVRVNGVDAITTDNFLHWETSVPLIEGENTLLVETGDNQSNVDNAAAQVEVSRSFQAGNFSGVDIDTENNRLLIADRTINSLIALDLSNNFAAVFSGDTVGLGPVFSYPVEVLVDTANNRALVIDSGQNALFAVDLDSGDRTIISDATTGSGPGFILPNDVIFSDRANEVLVIDLYLSALFAVDLVTGNRTIISENSPIIGVTNLISPTAIALDAANNRVLVADKFDIMAVDLNTGDKSYVSRQFSGPFFQNPSDIVFDSENNQIFLSDQTQDRIFMVDLNAGETSIYSDRMDENRIRYSSPAGLLIDKTNKRILVADSPRNSIIEINTETKTHTQLYSNLRNGNGDFLNYPWKLTLDHINNRAFVADGMSNRILEVDLATGDRSLVPNNYSGEFSPLAINGLAFVDAQNKIYFASSYFGAIDVSTGEITVLSDDSTGAGPQFSRLYDVVTDAMSDRFLVADDFSNAIFSIAMSSGDRAIVSDNSTGIGDGLSQPRHLALDASNNRVFVGGNYSILSVDLSNGNRSMISNQTKGLGPQIGLIEGIDMDNSNNRIIVSQSSTASLLSVDLTTGDRTVLSNSATGIGPEFETLREVAFHEEQNYILIVDYHKHALIAVEPQSGDRVIVSR